MKKELADKLQKKFPEILRELYGKPRETCMAHGIAGSDYWYEVIENGLTILQTYTDKSNFPQVVAKQIKEKYGYLCFYYELEENNKNITDYEKGFIAGIVCLMGSNCNKICYRCGSRDELQKRGHYNVCKECVFKEMMYRK